MVCRNSRYRGASSRLSTSRFSAPAKPTTAACKRRPSPASLRRTRGRRNRSAASPPRSKHQRGFVKLQARRAREKLAVVAVAYIGDKVHLPLPVREELAVHFFRVEARHRSDIQPKGACRQDEIAALKR